MLIMKIFRFTIRRLKHIEPQNWIQKPNDAPTQFHKEDLSHLKIYNYREIKKKYTRKIDESMIAPISPVMGAIRINLPTIHNKMYRWCTCGNSLKQPLCDNSHKGTSFKPMRFTVEQPVKQLWLCGCKLTTNRPFCDHKGCHGLAQYKTKAQLQQVQKGHRYQQEDLTDAQKAEALQFQQQRKNKKK